MIFQNTRVHAKKWIIIYLIILIIFSSIVFTTNYMIDPFGNRNWIVKKIYKPIVHERSEKYNYIFHQHNIHQYNCLILGSSRVMSIIPKSNHATEQCYNFGVHVANNAEKLFILQEWLKHAPLKTVYLGNELYNVHSNTRPLYLDKHKFTHGSEGNYLSVSTFFISLKTLRNSIENKPQTYFEIDGSIRYPREEEAIRTGKFDHSYLHFKEMAHGNIQNDYINNKFIYTSKALDPLKTIQSICDRNNIQLYSFVTPTFYETQLISQSNSSLKRASQKFQNDLIKIFGTLYNFDTNAVENKDQKNFYDNVHYRPKIGTLILERFHEQNDYGEILHDNHATKELNAI